MDQLFAAADKHAGSIAEAIDAVAAHGPVVANPPPCVEYVPLLDVDPPDESEDEEEEEQRVIDSQQGPGVRSREPPFCFLCWFGTQPSDAQRRQYVSILEAMIQTNAAFVNHRWLSQQVQVFYNKFLRPSIASPELRRHWSKRVIWEHITKHRLDPLHTALSSARALNAMRMQLESNGLCIRRSDGGPGRLDVQNAKLYLAVTKALTSAMTTLKGMRSSGTGATRNEASLSAP